MSDRKEKYDRRQKARERRIQDSTQARRRNTFKNVGFLMAGLVVIAALGAGVVALINSAKELPPTGFTVAHLEQYPSRQINLEPIPRLIQEHIMERGGPHPDGGMLVQYNCLDYQCDSELPNELEAIVLDFPSQVYLAPYPGMDAMIALAAPGNLEVLDEFDEGRIRTFIRNNLNN